MLKLCKPTTPSQRNLIKLVSELSHKKPLLKNLIKGLKNCSGRNNQGKITTRHKGGGHKRNYRKIDFEKRTNSSMIVISLEYDPNRTANVASLYDYGNGSYSYIISPKYLKVGDIIKVGEEAGIYLGHILPLAKIPEGTLIHNVWHTEGGSATLSRSAGTFCQVLDREPEYSRLELSSGSIKNFSLKCMGSVGIVSNDLHSLRLINKAGRSRWLNKRPTVRGVAMNPVDHPHGGGEGKKSGKNYTPWGKRK